VLTAAPDLYAFDVFFYFVVSGLPPRPLSEGLPFRGHGFKGSLKYEVVSDRALPDKVISIQLLVLWSIGVIASQSLLLSSVQFITRGASSLQPHSVMLPRVTSSKEEGAVRAGSLT